jgi:membrane fusion protein (multidrug efflux system)
MAMAKFHLSATNIKAPFSGTIGPNSKSFEPIDEGELLTVFQITEMFAYFKCIWSQNI